MFDCVEVIEDARLCKNAQELLTSATLWALENQVIDIVSERLYVRMLYAVGVDAG